MEQLLQSDMGIFVIGGGIFASVILLLFAFADAGGSRKMQARLKKVTESESPLEEAIKRSLRRGGDRKEGSLDKFLGPYVPRPELLKARIERTGLNITIGQYAGAAAVVGVIVAALFWFLKVPLVVALLAGVMTGLMVPQFVISRLGSRRVNKFLKTFPEAIDLMVRGLRSGLPVSESITAVAEELGGPVGQEFATISQSVRMGENVERAMWEVSKRIDVQEYKFLIIAMSIQRETGGNLAETLSNLSELLRKRQQLKLKIKAMSSEARASAWIIGSLPFLMFGLLLMINYDYMSLLFSDPRGMMLIAFALTMIVVGIGIMAKMVRFEI